MREKENEDSLNAPSLPSTSLAPCQTTTPLSLFPPLSAPALSRPSLSTSSRLSILAQTELACPAEWQERVLRHRGGGAVDGEDGEEGEGERMGRGLRHAWTEVEGEEEKDASKQSVGSSVEP